MDTGSLLLIVVVAVVVVAAVAFAVKASTSKRKERDRTRAAELREQASAQATGVAQHETHAREAAAAAEEARAEAERKVAEADRLEAEAADREAAATRVREEHRENLRRADELDPDVEHTAPTTDTAVPEAAGEASASPGAGATEPVEREPVEPVRTERSEGTHRA